MGVMRCLITAALFVLSFSASWPQSVASPDCSTLKYEERPSAWLCGEALVCNGDICGRPSMLDFGDQFDVVLRDKRGNELASKKLSYEQRKFCFEGRSDGDYQIAFVLYEKGAPQPARVFPTKYTHKPEKPNDKIYMIEAVCPASAR